MLTDTGSRLCYKAFRPLPKFLTMFIGDQIMINKNYDANGNRLDPKGRGKK